MGDGGLSDIEGLGGGGDILIFSYIIKGTIKVKIHEGHPFHK